MSIFKMYSEKDSIFNCFIKNSALLIIINVLTVAVITGLFATSHLIPALILTSLFILYISFCEIYIRRFKEAGSLEINQSSLKWTIENKHIELGPTEIGKIIIVKEFFFSVVSQGFEYVLIDIIKEDKSASRLAIKKHSRNRHEFDVLKTLRLFSEHNGIALLKK